MNRAPPSPPAPLAELRDRCMTLAVSSAVDPLRPVAPEPLCDEVRLGVGSLLPELILTPGRMSGRLPARRGLQLSAGLTRCCDHDHALPRGHDSHTITGE